MKDWGSDTNHSGGLHQVLWTETCNVNCGQSGRVTKVLLSTNTYTYDLSVWWFVLILSELEKSHFQPLYSVCWNVFSMKIIQQDLMELLMWCWASQSKTWEDLQFLHSVVILESELWCSDLQIETRKSLKFWMVSGDLEFFTQILCVWNLVSVSLYFCMSLCLSVSCHNSLIDLEMQKFEIFIVSCLKLSNQQGEGWQKNLSQKSWPIFWKMLHSGLDCICSSAIWSCFHV
jgi:hypothetical protein